MKIKIIKSKPAPGQDEITDLVGNEYHVLSYDKENKTVSVSEHTFDGAIVLQRAEYKILKPKTEDKA